MVTATPLGGFTDPVEVIRMSPDAIVVWGVVTAVLITVSAFAGAAVIAAIAPRPVEARNKRIKIQTPIATTVAVRFSVRLRPAAGRSPAERKRTMARNEMRRTPDLIRPPE